MTKFAKLITETSFDVELSESKGDKEFKIVGIYSSAEVMNNNNRKYKKDTLSREVDKVMEKVKNRCLWGELGHAPQPELSPDRIAILTESLEWKGNDLYGRSKVLDTPMGNIAKTLIKEGKMGISSRGLGTVDENSGYVNEDFRLICWDLVIDPSNSPSWINGIYEGKEFEIYGIKDVKIEEETITEAQAKEEFKKHIWQVIDQIKKNL